MNRRFSSIVPANLFLGVALSGCAGMMTFPDFGSPFAADGARSLVQDVVAAVAAYEDLDRGAAAAFRERRTVQALASVSGMMQTGGSSDGGAGMMQTGGTTASDPGMMAGGSMMGDTETLPASGSMMAGPGMMWLDSRFDRFDTVPGATLDMWQDAKVSPATSSIAEDGSFSVGMKVDASGDHGTHHLKVERSGPSRDELDRATFEIDRSLGRGMTMYTRREAAGGSDGVWNGAFESRIVRPDGRAKVVKWTFTARPDGSESARGTLTRFNGSMVDMMLELSEQSAITASGRDQTAGFGCEVSKKLFDRVAKARAWNGAGGNILEEAGILVDGTSEPSQD